MKTPTTERSMKTFNPLAEAAALFLGATLIVCGMAWGISSKTRSYEALRTHPQPTQTAEAK